MYLFGCLIMIILVPLLLVIGVAGTFISLLLGRRPSASIRWTNTSRSDSQQQSTTDDQQTSQTAPTEKQKIFNKNDGEYVDFEEIK